MRVTPKKNRVPDIADIERAAWFARMAFGAPLARVDKTTRPVSLRSRFGVRP